MDEAGGMAVRDIGIPVRSVNWVRTFPGRARDGSPRVLAAMGQQADNLFVLSVDPRTGETRRFLASTPQSNYPTAAFLSRSGLLYVGCADSGRLLVYDPEAEALRDLGAIHPGAAVFVCGIDEDERGVLWIGSYGTCDLTSFDPSTGTFTRYGRMDDTDMYNYPQAGEGGTVACLVRMTRPHVLVFHPATGRRETVGPTAATGGDEFSFYRAQDGRLYVRSSLGHCRIDGFTAVPVADPPAPLAPRDALPDGTRFSFADADTFLFEKLRLASPDGTERVLPLRYRKDGTRLYHLHRGPDRKLYGSSFLPLHLFRWDPDDGSLADLGQCSAANGQAYSMANLGGSLYISAYGDAYLSVYDPSRPYRFGAGSGDNPRDLGRIDGTCCRPRSTLAGPLGRVWVAAVPNYGTWGGPLCWYDPATGEKKAYRGVCGEASCYTLAWLPDAGPEGFLAVGTTIQGGTGTKPRAERASLFLWDCAAERKAWEGTPDRTVHAFNALLAGTGGSLYATVTAEGEPAELVLFDASRRAFQRRVRLPDGTPLDLGLQWGPDGRIYGFTSSWLFRADPRTLEIEPILRESFSVPGPILDGEILFATGHVLRAARLF